MKNILAPLTWLARHPITRRHRLRTWWRWIYWQVRQRMTNAAKVIPFYGGTRLVIYPREGLTGYWYVGLPEYEEMMFLQRFLRQGDAFVDVGANAGAFAVLAAGLGCRVVALEPVPQTFRRLLENVELNRNLGPIVAMNVAAGASPGILRMSTGFGTGNHVLKPDEDVPCVEVAVVMLDEAIPTFDAPTFVKIDVEGHEWEVIQGAIALLRSDALLGLLIETFRPHNWKLPRLQALEARLGEYGFFPYDYSVEENAIRRLETPQDGGFNTFYLRLPEVVAQRLRSAAR